MKITGNKLKRNTVKAPTLVPAEKHVFAITNVTKGVKNKRNLNLSRMTHLFFFLNLSLTILYLKKKKGKRLETKYSQSSFVILGTLNDFIERKTK